MAGELEGRTALVTGAGRGIGQAVAERLAAAGALVAVNFTPEEEDTAPTVARIGQAGGEAFALPVRLGGQAAARELAGMLEEELVRRTGKGGLDILVNTIGGTDYAPMLTVTEEFYDCDMSNNVRAPFFVVQALYHRINDFGRVINISSAGARLTDPSIITYTMAKAALNAFTRVLAQELGGRGITVNSVGPGFTAGPTNEGLMADAEALGQVIEQTALGRFGRPKEIADVVLALASPLGRWVTAQNIEASGGFKL